MFPAHLRASPVGTDINIAACKSVKTMKLVGKRKSLKGAYQLFKKNGFQESWYEEWALQMSSGHFLDRKFLNAFEGF